MKFIHQKSKFLQLKCCGINAPSDWSPVLGDKKLPGSCCAKGIEDVSCSEALYKTGCKTAFIEFLKNNLIIVAGLSVGTAVIQVITYFIFLESFAQNLRNLKNKTFGENVLLNFNPSFFISF